MASSKAVTPGEYILELPEEKQAVISKLRKEILKNLPKGFEEIMNYGMIGYVVPHSLYPKGYHCEPRQPLPFMGLAAQKNHIAVYHMGVYADPALASWFTQAFEQTGMGRLDMGKSCIRFKNPQKIPYELMGELASKMSVKDWINLYESQMIR